MVGTGPGVDRKSVASHLPPTETEIGSASVHNPPSLAEFVVSRVHFLSSGGGLQKK